MCCNLENIEVFQHIFWVFHPSIDEFNHCHPILSIEGTHLYGKYKDTLMIAMGCDGNNKLFSLAFAITERENIDSWEWFLACIRNKVTQWMRLCVISDVHLVWIEPYAYHRI